MPRRGKGTAGDSVGSASVEIAAEIVITNEDEIAQVAAQAASEGKGSGRGRDRDVAGSGRDAAPRSVNVDAKVNTKLNRDVSKDVQDALAHDFEINIDVNHLRQQIAAALQKPFEITVNAKVEGLAARETAAPGMTATPTPAPVRAEMSQRLRGQEARFRDPVDRLHDALAEGMPGFKAMAAAGNTFEKIEEVMSFFNASKFEDLLKVNAKGGFPQAIGGALSAQSLMARGISEEIALDIENAMRGFTTSDKGNYRESEARIFIQQMAEYMSTGAPAAGPAPAAAAPTPPPRTAQEARAPEVARMQAAAEELAKAADVARETYQLQGQRSLQFMPIESSGFQTPPLGSRRPNRMEIPTEAEVEKLQRDYADAKPGREREAIEQRLAFIASLSEPTAMEAAFAKAGVASTRRGPGGTPLEQNPARTGRGRSVQGVNPEFDPNAPQGSMTATTVPPKTREEVLRASGMAQDWMMQRGLVGRAPMIGNSDIAPFDLEPYLRLARTGSFENAFERFEKVKPKGGGKAVMQSEGIGYLTPSYSTEEGIMPEAGYEELGRLHNMPPGRRPRELKIGGEEGKFYSRVDPREALIRTIIEEQGGAEEPATADAIRSLLEPYTEMLRDAISFGSKNRGETSTGFIGTGTGEDMSRLPEKIFEFKELALGEIEKLSGFIDNANEDLARTGKAALTPEGRKFKLAKIDEWNGYIAQRQEQLRQIAEIEEEAGLNLPGAQPMSQEMYLRRRAYPDRAAAADAEQARLQRARDEARVVRDRENDVVGRQVGLTEKQKAFSEAGEGGSASGQARARLYKILSSLEQAPKLKRDEESQERDDVISLLEDRFLATPGRVNPSTGLVESGYQTLKRAAFGETGKPRQKYTEQNPGGLLGELMGMLPEDASRERKSVIREGITDVLRGFIEDQGARIGRAREEADRKENVAGMNPRLRFNQETQSALASMSGEGVYATGGPGLLGQIRGDIAAEEARQAREVELEAEIKRRRGGPRRELEHELSVLRDKDLTPRPSLDDVTKVDDKGVLTTTPGLRTRLRQLETIQANVGAETFARAEARAKTVGKGSTVTGDQLRQAFIDEGVLTNEVIPAVERPFADLRERLGMSDEEPPVIRGGSRDRPPVAEVPPGFVDRGGRGRPPAPPGGEERSFDITGPIHVIVDNVPLQVAWSGAAPTTGQQGIAGRSRADRAMADLGAQTSPEFQDAFRMESERLVGEGMTANDVRKMAEKMGLGPAAAMYFGRGGQPPAGGAAPPSGPAPYGANFPKLNYIPDPREAPLPQAMRLRPLPTARVSPEQKAAERDAERARREDALNAAAEFEAIDQFQRSEKRQAADAARDERARQTDLARARRTARVNDPVGFAEQRDLADEALKEIRGQNRAIQRRVPRRGFGASLTDLITSIVGRGPLEDQLEAADRAQREVTEINQAAEKRSQLVTQRRGVLQQARALPRGDDRRLGLLEQARELRAAAGAQTEIIKKSTENFNKNAEAVRKNTAAAFGAAAVGSIGSIGIGAITFGLGSAIAAPIITAVAEGLTAGLAPAIEQASGFAATTARTTLAAAEEIRGRGGDVGAVSGIAARTGIGAAAFEQIGGGVVDRAQVEAGNLALRDQIDLLRVSRNIAREGGRQGLDQGLFQQTGGVSAFGLRAFGVPSTAELLADELAGLPQTRSSRDNERIAELDRLLAGNLPGRQRQALNIERLRLGSTQETLNPEDAKKTSDSLIVFNEALRKGDSAMRLFIDTTGEASETSAKAARDLGLDKLAQTFEEQGLAVSGVRNAGDLASALQAMNRGATTPDVRLLLEETARERRARAEMRQANLRFGLEQAPVQQALQFAQRPFSDASAGIVFGQGDSAATQKALNTELASTQKLYNQINAEVQVGMDQAVKFVEFGADIFGTGQLVGGLGAEAAQDFATALGNVYSIGKQISQIEIGLQTKQAAYQAAQFSYQINIAKRSLADAKGLAGELTSASKDNLGVIEREMFMLQRRAQMMQMELNQRQINFQRAVAGFTAPGLTGEERAARIQQAKIEADFAQKQLDIQKQLFGLQGRQFDISASRGVQDLTQQLALLERGRVITLETAAAEKKIRALTFLQEKENAKVQAFYKAAVEATNDIAGEIQQLAVASGKLMTSVADDVISETIRVMKEIAAAANRVVNPNNPSGRGTGPDDDEGRLPGAAVGRNLMAGQSYWVGESGREIITPEQNSIVTAGANIQVGGITPMGGGGESPINITIMVTGNNVTSEDELAKLEERIFQAVERATSRKISLLGGRSY